MSSERLPARVLVFTCDNRMLSGELIHLKRIHRENGDVDFDARVIYDNPVFQNVKLEAVDIVGSIHEATDPPCKN